MLLRFIPRAKIFTRSIHPTTTLASLNKPLSTSSLLKRTFASNVKPLEHKINKPKTDFEKIGGYSDIREQVSNFVLYLQNPKAFTEKGIKHLKGFILSGPPGVGKTLAAEAIAGHAGVPIIIISASKLIDTFVGATESHLRELFELAKKNAPCVICIDEIDSIANKRFSKISQGSEHHVNTIVNQFLTLLEENNPGIIVIGTTNNFDLLDPAIVRAGRFDQHIFVPMPNKEDRLEILTLHTKTKKLDSSVNLKDLSRLCVGYSGAQLADLVNKAAIFSSNELSNTITLKHFSKAISVIYFGTLGRVHVDPELLHAAAIHETGHALVGYLLGMNLYKISTRSTGESNGHTQFIPKDGNKTKEEILDEICCLLAGRAAELAFDKVRVGGRKDLEKTKKLAEYLVTQEGMGSTLSGVINIEIEVETILQTQMLRAKKMLEENNDHFWRVVKILKQKNEIFGDEFKDIITNKKSDFIKNIIDTFAEKEKVFTFPPKKPFFNSFEDKKNDSLPFTDDQIASAFDISPRYIRSVTSEKDGFLIKLKPSYTDLDTLEKIISPALTKNDIEHCFSQENKPGSAGNITITIYKDGVKEFIEFVTARSGRKLRL